MRHTNPFHAVISTEGVSDLNPTLADIARETRTSASTVSRVLAGGATAARISAPTRQRVQEAARALGYRPNLIARSLRTRRTHTVALLVSDIANPFFAQIGSLVEQKLHGLGYSLVLCNSSENAEHEVEYLQVLGQKAIDGLILVPLLRSRKVLHQYIGETFPLVILDRPIAGIPSCVASDQEQAAGGLCDTLEQAGIRTVALVSGPRGVITHRRRAQIVSRRFKVIEYHEGPAQKETGRQAFIRFLGHRPDAIVCTNNFLAHGVIDSIAQIEQPPTMGVFDEVPMMHLLPVPIACCLQDIPRLAEGCVNQLMPQLTGETRLLKPVVVPTRVISNQAFRVRQFRT